MAPWLLVQFFDSICNCQFSRLSDVWLHSVLLLEAICVLVSKCTVYFIIIYYLPIGGGTVGIVGPEERQSWEIVI